MTQTLKGSNPEVGSTLSGSQTLSSSSGGFAQNRSPPAINFHPFGIVKTCQENKKLPLCFTDKQYISSVSSVLIRGLLKAGRNPSSTRLLRPSKAIRQ